MGDAVGAATGGGGDVGGGKAGGGSLGAGDPFSSLGGGGGDPFSSMTGGLGGGGDPFSAFAMSPEEALTGVAGGQSPDVGAPELGGVQSGDTGTQDALRDVAGGKPPSLAPELPPESVRQQSIQQLREGMQSWQIGGQPVVPGPTGPVPQQPLAPGAGLSSLSDLVNPQRTGLVSGSMLEDAGVRPVPGQFPDQPAPSAGPEQTPAAATPTSSPAPASALQKTPAAAAAPDTGERAPQMPQAPSGARGAPGAPGGGAGGGLPSPLLQIVQQLMRMGAGGAGGGPAAIQPFAQLLQALARGAGGAGGTGGGTSPLEQIVQQLMQQMGIPMQNRIGQQQPGGDQTPQPGTPVTNAVTGQPVTEVPMHFGPGGFVPAMPGTPGARAPSSVPPPPGGGLPARGGETSLPPPGTAGNIPGNIPPPPAVPVRTADGQSIAPIGRGQVAIPSWSAAARNPPSMRPTQATVDRSSFRAELERNPNLLYRAAWMVNGEVGRHAPLQAKITQLETVFNRSQMRGQGLGQGLLTIRTRGGYYANNTYSASARPTAQEFRQFIREVATPVLNGSNVSDIGYGPMTGNASDVFPGRGPMRGNTASNQFQKGTLGYSLRGGDTYFREPAGDGRFYKLPEIQRAPTTPDPATAGTPPPREFQETGTGATAA